MLSPLVTECRRKDRHIAQLENALAWLRDELTSVGSPGRPRTDKAPTLPKTLWEMTDEALAG